MKPKKYEILVKYTSKSGEVPDFRVLCGDTFFMVVREGDTMSFRRKLIRKGVKK